jgi:predicted HicB family RNase H-like nuclease
MPKTDAQKRATSKFETKAYDKVLIRIRKDGDLTRKDIQRSADAKGESLNQYILKAVEMRMQADR